MPMPKAMPTNGLPQRPPTSSTTTEPMTASLPTTVRHGAIGSATPPSSLRAMAARGDPATHRILRASLEPLLSLSEKRIWTIDDPTRIGEVNGFLIKHDATDADIALAEEMIEAASAPLPNDKLMGELVRLRSMTVSRPTDEGDTAAILMFYADELSRHPGDVARMALRSRPGGKWWPAYEEIEEALERFGGERRMIAAAVRNRSFAENPDWPRWLEEIYGPLPDGPERRRAKLAAASSREIGQATPGPPPSQREPQLEPRDPEAVAAQIAEWKRQLGVET